MTTIRDLSDHYMMTVDEVTRCVPDGASYGPCDELPADILPAIHRAVCDALLMPMESEHPGVLVKTADGWWIEPLPD